jgi:hypothetical protein
MTEERQRQLDEAIKKWDTYVSKRDRQIATAKWEGPARSNSGQRDLLDAAKRGDVSAVNYLFLLLGSTVSKGFWRYVGNNPSFQRQRIAAGDQNVIAAMVYEILLSASYKNDSSRHTNTLEHEELMGTASPLNTFDYNAYSPESDLIPKVAFYIRGAMMNETQKANTSQSRNGVTGSLSKEEAESVVGATSIDSYEDPDRDLAHGAMDRGHSQVEHMDAWEEFVEANSLDLGKAPTPRQVLKFFLMQDTRFSPESMHAACDEFDAGRNTIDARMAKVGEAMSRAGLTREGFVQLITSVGGEDLAATL